MNIFWNFVKNWNEKNINEDNGLQVIINKYNSKPIYETTEGLSGFMDLFNLKKPTLSDIFITSYAVGLGIRHSYIVENGFIRKEDINLFLVDFSKQQQRKSCWEANRVTAGFEKLQCGLNYLFNNVDKLLSEFVKINKHSEIFALLKRLPYVGDYRALNMLKCLRLCNAASLNFTTTIIGPGAQKGLTQLKKLMNKKKRNETYIMELLECYPRHLLSRTPDHVDIEHMLCYFNVWVKKSKFFLETQEK